MDAITGQFLGKQGEEQRKIIEKLRKLISANFPGLKEEGMAEGLWYGGKFYITSFSDHVNLGVGVEGLSENEIKNFEGKGKTMRHLKFYPEKGLNEIKLLELMELVFEKSKCSCDFKRKK